MNYYDSHTIIYVSGKYLLATEARGDLYSQTLHYGNGVFEGIRAYETPDGPKIFKAREHFERLVFSAGTMGLRVGESIEEMTHIAYKVLEANGFGDAYIRPLVVADPSMGLGTAEKAHLVMMAWQWPPLLGDAPVRLMISSYLRPHPKTVHVEAKVCGHYVNSILASTEAKKLGFNDAIMLDVEDHLAECSGANIFVEKDHTLYTPALGHILPGITRQTVIDLAREMQIPVVEKHLTVDDLKAADAMFMVGTAAEVTGVTAVGDIHFPLEWDNTFGHVLARKYHMMVTHADPQPATLI